MIGQKELFDRLDKYDLNTLPKSNLVIGEYGCGKHSFINFVCNKFKLEYIDITNELSNEFILDLYTNSQPSLYVIDINELSKKSRYINKENSILKFVEEPPINAYIFILCEYDSQIINTIKNRCVEWKFSNYTIDELRTFKTFNDIKIYNILNTPGKLINSKDESFYSNLFELCDTIIVKINKANISNTLSLDRYLETYDVDMFLKALKYIVYMKCCETYTNKLFLKYDLIIKYIEKAHCLGISLKQLFDNFLLELKLIDD